MRAASVLCLFAAGGLAAACNVGSSSGDLDAALTDAPMDDAQVDAPVDAPVDAANPDPMLLSETGLYSDIANHTIGPGVVEFMPRWELFSDGANKRRWIYLPPGTTIDTSDMDFWSLPQGTKVWKEFARDGRRIETRFLWKQGTTNHWADWFVVSFQWSEDESDATAVPSGVPDAEGLNDIPSRNQCRTCHDSGRNPAVLLGFSALQLDYDAAGSLFDLAQLVAEDRLSHDPTGSPPYFPLPAAGTAGSAFGYLHSNCGGCHNSRSALTQGPTPDVPLQLRLSTAADARTSWMATATWQHTVGIMGSRGGTIVTAGVLNQSTLYQRMTTNGGTRMPPLGRETTDDAGGVAAVSAWILSLAP